MTGMKRISTPVLCAVALTLCACARINVRVSVLDPRVAERETDRLIARKDLPALLAETDGTIRARVEERRNLHAKLYKSVAKGLTAVSAGLSAEKKASLARQASEVLTAFSVNVAPQYDTLELRMIGSLRRTTALCGRSVARLAECSVSDTVAAAREVETYYTAWRGILALLPADSAFFRLQATNIRQNATAGVRGAAESAVGEAENTLNIARTSILAGRVLVLDSPFLYSIASAPEQMWAQAYNEVRAGGFFGNLDVAIKLDPEGDFSLKGLAFDPRDVARTAAKVGTQAILLTAQIAGVATPLSQVATATSQNSPGLATSSSTLQQLLVEQSKAEADNASSRAALRQIASMLLERYEELSDDAVSNKATIELLKASYSAMKSRLTAPSASAAATKPAEAPHN